MILPIAGLAAWSAVGLMAMGGAAYLIGRSAGRRAVQAFGDAQRLKGIEAAFARNGRLTRVVCQALPILPELWRSSC